MTKIEARAPSIMTREIMLKVHLFKMRLIHLGPLKHGVFLHNHSAFYLYSVLRSDL